MGVQFENVTYAASHSLTLVIDDVVRQQRDAREYAAAPAGDLGGWLNALSRQAAPLIQAGSNRENLEAWLAAVEEQFNVSDSNIRL